LLHPGCGSRIPGIKKHRIPDPTSFLHRLLTHFVNLSRIRIQPLLHPGSGSRIRGVKKHRIPEPGSATLVRSNQILTLTLLRASEFRSRAKKVQTASFTMSGSEVILTRVCKRIPRCSFVCRAILIFQLIAILNLKQLCTVFEMVYEANI
jgi:hypothetical protein